MRWMTMAALLALAGCGGGATGAPPSPRATTPPVGRAIGEAPATATPSFTASRRGPWTARPAKRRSPQACPASSSRAGWPSRVLALGDGSYAKLWGRRPRYASVDWRGHLYETIELGARKQTSVRAFACWRQGRTGAAWIEYRGDGKYALRVSLRPDGAKTAEVVRGMYDDGGVTDVALAFTPDGTLLVVYAVFHEVRAVTMTGDSKLSEPVTLGPASERTALQAEISRSGRAVVAWTTIDAGEERNERRRIYAVTGRVGAFGPAQLVDRARHRNDMGATEVPVRLAVAPHGRAVLLWGTDTGDPDADWSTDEYLVSMAQAGPTGGFGPPRRLATAGLPGDVALRDNGPAVAVWTTANGLRAYAGDRPERVAEGRIADARASFRRGKPRIEWRGGVATRR